MKKILFIAMLFLSTLAHGQIRLSQIEPGFARIASINAFTAKQTVTASVNANYVTEIINSNAFGYGLLVQSAAIGTQPILNISSTTSDLFRVNGDGTIKLSILPTGTESYMVGYNPTTKYISYQAYTAPPTYTANGGLNLSTNNFTLDINSLPLISGASLVDADYVAIYDASVGADYKVLLSGFKTYIGTTGMSDPMTTRGDLIFRNASNITARLPIGANTYILTSNGTDVAWAAPTAGYTLPLAANGTRGGIQTGYTSTASNFALQLLSEKAFVALPDASISVKGIASFSTTNFIVSSAAVSIKTSGITNSNLSDNIVGFSKLSTYNAASEGNVLGYSSTYGLVWTSRLSGTGSAGKVAYWGDASTINYDADYGYNGTTNALIVGSGSGNGSVTSGNFILSSDKRLKERIRRMENLDWVDDIQFKNFEFKGDVNDKLRYGVIAQEVQKVNPELVFTDDNGYKAVGYIDLLVAKVVRQDEIINELTKRLEKLENEK